MRLLQRRVIENFKGEPYLIRYTLFSCKWFGIFIHKILRSDSDRDLHDHPWPFTTILLRGHYVEDLPADSPPMYDEKGAMYVKPHVCKAGSIIRHRASDCHCLTLPMTFRYDGFEGTTNQSLHIPVWSLFIHGRRSREWGFHTAKGWVHWEEYLKHNREIDTSPMAD